MALCLVRFFAFCLALQSALASPIAWWPWKNTKEPGYTGAVASESTICSQIGTDLLKKGGNAADALVGTVACIGTVAMYHSGMSSHSVSLRHVLLKSVDAMLTNPLGLGGGGFMVVRSSTGQYEFIDFRETAPAAATKDMYLNNEPASRLGGLASGVPGEVRGLHYLHEKYGKLDWFTVLNPTVRLARRGWKVSDDLLRYINSTISGANQNATSNTFIDDPEFAQDFAPNGRLPKLGETITRKRYSKTLETIARKGPDAFYKGPIAEATIRSLKAKGGIMTLEDLSNYTVAIRKPLSSE
jgi:gamma-glutamyltranspeptidase/glutathione hydrolase